MKEEDEDFRFDRGPLRRSSSLCDLWSQRGLNPIKLTYGLSRADGRLH